MWSILAILFAIAAVLHLNVSNLLWGQSGVLLEITAEKTGVGEMVFPGYFLYALSCSLEL